MYAMLTQKLSKGFKSWSDMLKENKDKLDRHGMTLIYAGSHADDDNSMIAIIHWESKEGMMSFKNDEELTKIREEAGAITEWTEVKVLTDESLHNIPKAL